MENKSVIAVATAGVSFLTAYKSYIDSKEDRSQMIPSILMVALSGYLAFIQFRSARQEILIAQTQKKLGTVNLNQSIG